MSAVEATSDTASARDFRWQPGVRLRGASRLALTCPASSCVSYDLMLPAGARIVSWCAVMPRERHRSPGAILFEIRVRTESGEALVQRPISPKTSWLGRRWRRLAVRAAGSGATRISLATRALDGRTGVDGACALWGDPRIEVRRSLADVVTLVRSSVSRGNARTLWQRALPPDTDRLYALWVREHEPSSKELRSQRVTSQTATRSFTLLTHLGNDVTALSEPTVASVVGQSYPRWEWLLIVFDSSVDEASRLAARLGSDGRIRVVAVPDGSSRADAWDAGLHASTHEYVALLDPDDVVALSALYEMASALDRVGNADVVYSDEDVLSAGHRRDPQFKPGWSPDLLLSRNYIGRLSLLRVAAAQAAGGFRRGYDGAEEWDLLLRLSRSSARIERVPLCLYHRANAARPAPSESVEKAIQEHCGRAGLRPVSIEAARGRRVSWEIQAQATVSIIIPNRNAAEVLEQCVHGVSERTNYAQTELVIVDNGSTDPAVLRLYRSLESRRQGRIVPFDRPFNFSAACNAGAAAASGDLLLFLNNDVEVIEPEWLDELVRWAQRPEIGIVGAKLLYPDRMIQHAGVVFGVGLVGHIFARAPEHTCGLFGSSECYRNYLAVTGACQMMRRDVFKQLGGYDERFRLSFSDVVLCMEAWKAGYRVVYTPFARLIHHESYTRKRQDSAEDMELLARYLRTTGFVQDPFFHPELDPKSSTPALRPPFDPTAEQVVRDYVERVLATTTL